MEARPLGYDNEEHATAVIVALRVRSGVKGPVYLMPDSAVPLKAHAAVMEVFGEYCM